MGDPIRLRDRYAIAGIGLSRFGKVPGTSTMGFTLEAAQRPLRSAEDLLQAAGVPVLAVLPPSQSTRAQRLIGGTGPSVAPPSLRLGH